MRTRENFDIAIIGCGIAGIYAAYELVKLNPELGVIVLEQGKNIYNRSCPMVEHKSKTCLSCSACAIMHGFGGAGAFSDGKYNFTTEFGGWLKDYRPEPEIMELINYVDSVNVGFGATEVVYSTGSDAATEAGKAGFGK